MFGIAFVRFKQQMLWVITLIGWLMSFGLMCLGALLIVFAPLSRLGVGEPGTGMSIEEMERLNAKIAASPWPPLICLLVGLALLVAPPSLSALWTFWVWRKSRTVVGARSGVPPIIAEQGHEVPIWNFKVLR
jgi:hypothetical protein